MERHHDYELSRRLETVFDEGCVYVLKSELRRWYGRKIAARTLRDLEERWQEISGGEAGPLKRIGNAGGIYLLAGDRIDLISDEQAEDEEE